MTYFGDARREFWLPIGRLAPILYTGEITMFASSFEAGPQEQWLDRVMVAGVDGLRLFEVAIKKDIESVSHTNKSKSSRDTFETIDVTVGMAPSPLLAMPPPNGFFRSQMGVHFGVSKVDQLFEGGTRFVKGQGTNIGRARREAVQIRCKSAHIFIVSSPAREYFAYPTLAAKYAHLDIIIHEMYDRTRLRGLLPELWGFRRISNETRSRMVPPWLGLHARPEPGSGQFLI